MEGIVSPIVEKLRENAGFIMDKESAPIPIIEEAPQDVSPTTQSINRNIYIKPSDPDFKKHKGYFPEAGIKRALEGYKKYVIDAGRTIPIDLWMGTALQESGFGKYMFNHDRKAAPLVSEKVYEEKGAMNENPMYGEPDEKYMKKIEKKYAPDWSKQIMNKQSYGGEIYDNVVKAAKENPYGFIKKLDANGIEDDASLIPEYMKIYLETQKRGIAQNNMSRENFDPAQDYAAQKLQEGINKFKSSEAAARWYNRRDPVPREKIPALGRDVLRNPDVQKMFNEINTKNIGG